MQWFQLVVANRQNGQSDTLTDIDDIRNGFMASNDLHNDYFEKRSAAVLKTPNGTNDVPSPATRKFRGGLAYPPASRYTLQWIHNDDDISREDYPNNTDAAFLAQNLPKSFDLLLH